MSDVSRVQNGTDRNVLSVALIGPHEQRRKAIAEALAARSPVHIEEFAYYPTDLDHVARVLEERCSVIIIDADSDPDTALHLAESICSRGQAAVMAYSAEADVKLAIRFMRIGVSEFFTFPFDATEVAEALRRASAREPAPRPTVRTSSKVFVFLGTKGGCGVTAISSNFAISIAQESAQNTLLIDLGLPLGDAAINLGMTTEFSVANAIHDPTRLDGNFLRTLLATHSSGLSVLAAPSDFRSEQLPDNDAVNKLIAVARQSFDYIVVDAGSRLDLLGSSLFEESSIVYLITQVGISELRNANRMISQFFGRRTDNLQIVLNRYKPATLLFDDKHIEKALTRPTDWKIPDDWSSARRTQNTATPMALADAPISLAIRQMARTACGLSADREEKKRLFGFFAKPHAKLGGSA
jgi:pilus assembly protein CpaE